jgi:hypothetical protein
MRFHRSVAKARDAGQDDIADFVQTEGLGFPLLDNTPRSARTVSATAHLLHLIQTLRSPVLLPVGA